MTERESWTTSSDLDVVGLPEQLGPFDPAGERAQEHRRHLVWRVGAVVVVVEVTTRRAGASTTVVGAASCPRPGP